MTMRRWNDFTIS